MRGGKGRSSKVTIENLRHRTKRPVTKARQAYQSTHDHKGGCENKMAATTDQGEENNGDRVEQREGGETQVKLDRAKRRSGSKRNSAKYPVTKTRQAYQIRTTTREGGVRKQDGGHDRPSREKQWRSSRAMKKEGRDARKQRRRGIDARG